MDPARFIRQAEFEWRFDAIEGMHVPAILFASEALLKAMDDKVLEQIIHVASLPGIVHAALTMPDAHWGYGFPIGGVAAFDPDEGGIISAGGVGFDISCGVRSLLTHLHKDEIAPFKTALADELFRAIPAGVGSGGKIRLNESEMDKMLKGGAAWAIKQGYGKKTDLEHTEDNGIASGAVPEYVSSQAKKRQQNEMGTLGSGNHYLELQVIDEIFDETIATAYDLVKNEVVVSIHCGSRGLGHQIGTDFLREMALAAPKFGIKLPDRELACAPLQSELGQRYLGAMRAGINCALANRQIITHLVREAFNRVIPGTNLDLLYDVSHNTCKEETHEIDGRNRSVFIHRKGATRAFGPNHPSLPLDYKKAGQPVLIGGSMGTCSYILAGTTLGEQRSLSSSCHGAGRSLSRTQASKQWQGRQLRDDLEKHNILIRCLSQRGLAEEAPGAYKDVNEVVEVAERSGISKKVAKLLPIVCVKG